MINFIKKNKLLSTLIIITLITFIIGIFISSILSKDIEKEITNNIINLLNEIKSHNIHPTNTLKAIILNNILVLLIIWLLGISVIGIPIVLSIYILKVLTLSLEFIYLILNIKRISIFFIIIYLIPNIINLIIYFFILYYSINYSLILSKSLFLKKEYKLKLITKRYMKVLLISLISITINSLLEVLVIPKLLIFLIK